MSKKEIGYQPLQSSSVTTSCLQRLAPHVAVRTSGYSALDDLTGQPTRPSYYFEWQKAPLFAYPGHRLALHPDRVERSCILTLPVWVMKVALLLSSETLRHYPSRVAATGYLEHLTSDEI